MHFCLTFDVLSHSVLIPQRLNHRVDSVPLRARDRHHSLVEPLVMPLHKLLIEGIVLEFSTLLFIDAPIVEYVLKFVLGRNLSPVVDVHGIHFNELVHVDVGEVRDRWVFTIKVSIAQWSRVFLRSLMQGDILVIAHTFVLFSSRHFSQPVPSCHLLLSCSRFLVSFRIQ